MACIEMQYSQKGDPMSPRISFSIDFVESSNSHSNSQMMRNNYVAAPVSSEFEFCVSNYSMMSADQLFSKGKILPFKENCSTNLQKVTTLRDELQNQDADADADFSIRPPKNPTKWRGFLGLRKSQVGVKKSNKVESSRPDFHQTSKN